MRLIVCAATVVVFMACQREPVTVRTAAPAPSVPASSELLQLAAQSVQAGEKVLVRFPAPLPKEGERYWITLIEAGKPDSEWAEWQYVEVGAREVVLNAPAGPGRFEVRLHDRYPASPYHVLARAPLSVTIDRPVGLGSVAFDLRDADLNQGERPFLTFSRPLPKEGERYWITLVEARRLDSEYGDWKYVETGAREMELAPVGASGDFEVRLHANYPAKSHDVVYRTRLVVR